MVFGLQYFDVVNVVLFYVVIGLWKYVGSVV